MEYRIQIGYAQVIDRGPGCAEIYNSIIDKSTFITSDRGDAIDLALQIVTGQRVINRDAFERSLDETCPSVDTKLVA